MYQLIYTYPNGIREIYKGMICGLITEITQEGNGGRVFKTKTDAEKEKEKFKIHLEKFEVTPC